MEGLLQHQNSTAGFHKKYKRCMWDWLRIFDLHHQITVGKLLEDSSHGGRLAGHHYVPIRASEDGDLDDEPNFQIVSKDSKTKSSGKALLSSLVLKKLFRKHHRRLKSATPRLTRTNSIHHLECNDYVLPVEVTSECDFVSENTDSSERNGYLPQQPGIGRCGTMKLVNLVGQTELKDFTQNQAKSAEDALPRKKEPVEELRRDVEFQFHDDSFLETIDDSGLVLQNLLNDFYRSSSRRLLGKTGSLKSVDFPHKGPTNDSHNLLHTSFKSSTEEDAPKSEAAVVDDRSAYHNSDLLSRSSLQFTKQVTHGTLFSHYSTLKKSVKGAIDENRKEHLHISMDGLLHKVPYGQTVSGEVMKEKLLRSASARSYTESTKDNVSVPQKVYPSLRFRRSHSLSESDMFSHVLESSSTRESKSLPESLTSTKVDIGLTNKKSSTFRLFSCNDVINEPLDGTMLTKAAAPIYLVNKNEAVGILPDGSMSGDKIVNVKESVQPDGNKEQILYAHDDETNGGGIELLLIKNELTESNDVVPLPELMDQQESLIDHGQSQVHELSDSSHIQASHVTCEHELQVDSGDESIRPGPTSLLELDFEDDLFRPAKYEFPEDSEIVPIILNVEKFDLCAKANISDEIDTSKYDSDERKDIAFAAVDNSRTHLDRKDEADFNYVRNVLRKSCFNGFEFLVDPIPSLELADPSDDLESASHDSDDVSPDHQILSDLTNEILIELSERFSICSWFTRFGSCMRTMPTKCNVLEEVWKKASVHLNLQTVPAHMNEFVVAQDFAKDDGWLNLRQDAVAIGMEIESLLLDDFLEELAFEHLEYI